MFLLSEFRNYSLLKLIFVSEFFIDKTIIRGINEIFSMDDFISYNKNSISSYDAYIGDYGAIILANLISNDTINFSLELDNNQDRGAIEIADNIIGNNTLQTLSLHENRIRDRGAIALAHAIITTSIINLDLGGNDIGPIGIKSLAILGDHKTLKKFELWDNKGDSESFSILIKSFYNNKKLEYLGLSCNDIALESIINLLSVNTIIKIDIDHHFYHELLSYKNRFIGQRFL